MGKHAYLIIAHNKFEQLKMLCEMLDFEQNDIYMHIDAHVTTLMPIRSGLRCAIPR